MTDREFVEEIVNAYSKGKKCPHGEECCDPKKCIVYHMCGHEEQIREWMLFHPEKQEEKSITSEEIEDEYNKRFNKELKQDNGSKFDKDKIRLDLISIQAINGIGEVLTYGSQKYGDRNWEKGLTWSRVFGALLRHLFAFWLGKDLDEESDLDHIDHAMCCLMFLSHYKKTKTGVDDRNIIK